jgi:hypothetical protein
LNQRFTLRPAQGEWNGTGPFVLSAHGARSKHERNGGLPEDARMNAMKPESPDAVDENAAFDQVND